MTTKSPDLNLLPIVVALYDQLSVSRAAEHLGMSQPSVSKALRRLRESFGDPLFLRSSRGLVPPPRAHAIVGAARAHLEDLQAELRRSECFNPAASTRERCNWPANILFFQLGPRITYPTGRPITV